MGDEGVDPCPRPGLPRLPKDSDRTGEDMARFSGLWAATRQSGDPASSLRTQKDPQGNKQDVKALQPQQHQHCDDRQSSTADRGIRATHSHSGFEIQRVRETA